MAYLSATNDRPTETPNDQVASLRSAAMSCGRRWAVVQTHPQAEPWCATNLRQRGYSHYLALHAVRRRDPVVHSFYRTILVPLFVGYVFVDLGDNPWVPVRYCPGVRNLLMTDGHPAYAAAGAVERLQATDVIRLLPPSTAHVFAPGASCRLIAGPMTGFPAVIIAAAGETARVSVMIFGRLSDVTVPISHLAPPAEA